MERIRPGVFSWLISLKIHEISKLVVGRSTQKTTAKKSKLEGPTVDGRNPAPPGMVKTLEIMG